jgi:hypothetical protein
MCRSDCAGTYRVGPEYNRLCASSVPEKPIYYNTLPFRITFTLERKSGFRHLGCHRFKIRAILLTMPKIPGLQNYRDRKSNGTFEDLPFNLRNEAQMRLWHMCQPWGNDLPGWRYAILVGQARRLARNPPDSVWGRTMLAKRGGLAVQKLYKWEGINPTAKATTAHSRKLQATPRPKRRAGVIYTLPPGVLPHRSSPNEL